MVLQEHVQEHAAGAVEKFNAGETIIEHVSNSSLDHPLIQLPTVLGIDFSVTKHVFMLWLVAATVFVVVTWTVRRYLKQGGLIPHGPMNALEAVVEYVRDSIVLPNVGRKWVNTWTPLILTFFFFILFANAVGLIPIFEVAGPRRSLGAAHGRGLVRRSSSCTAGRRRRPTSTSPRPWRRITFGAIIIAGTKAHGFVKHWKNLVPHGLAPVLYVILIPIEIMGMFVRPFALTMRLAANMTGGHIAILAILSFVFLFAEMFGRAAAGIGVGLAVSVPLAVGISALEIIVVLVQAYVFTLLTAVFIGMAIHVHH